MRISIVFKILSLLALIVLSSCSTAKLSNGVSVYKRKYNKGRDTSFSNNSFTKSEISILSEKKESKKIFVEKYNISVPFVSNLNSKKSNFKNRIIKELMVSKLNSINSYSKLEDKCDVIVLNNGDERSVKVEEINETQIKYRLCNNQTGILYTINKSDFLLIRFQDGSKDVFDSVIKNEKNENEKETITISTILGLLGTLLGILIIFYIIDFKRQFGGL